MGKFIKWYTKLFLLQMSVTGINFFTIELLKQINDLTFFFLSSFFIFSLIHINKLYVWSYFILVKTNSIHIHTEFIQV